MHHLRLFILNLCAFAFVSGWAQEYSAGTFVDQGNLAASTEKHISLQRRIDSLLQAPFLAQSEVGIAVYDLTANQLLYRHQAEKFYRPASVQKLLTSVAAIDGLTAEYPVQTLVLTDGELQDTMLHGDLYLRGGFDSEFNEADMDNLVAQLYEQGIRRVTGKIYADVSMKDSLPYNPGWSWDDGYYYYQPELTPLIYHKGYLTLTFSPSTSQRPSTIKIDPPTSLYTIDNKTSGAGAFRLYRNLTEGNRVIHVRGRVRSTVSDHITVPRPYELFVDVFRSKALARGIQVGEYAGIRTIPPLVGLLGETSRPLSELLSRSLKNSDNLSAEALFYILANARRDGNTQRDIEGRDYIIDGISSDAVSGNNSDTTHTPISWEDGAAAVRELLRVVGVNDAECGISDGSGLSVYNSISPDAIISVLRYAAHRPRIMEALYPALAIAGVDGTLRNRMKGTPAQDNVHAKTGSLTGVSALAGYLTAPNGHVLAFAILNQNARRSADARNLQDAICTLLCTHKP